MPFPFRIRLLPTAFVAMSLLALGIATPQAGAVTTSLSTAEQSPIAVPFVGDYEVWCTDRNPAPGNRCSRHHGSPAIDLGMDPGTPLYAAGSGTVIDADTGCPPRGWCNNGKGNSVIIAHADGSFSRYLHMADVAVANDQVVRFGEQIGTSGESGQSSSPHLHYDEHFPFGTRTDMGQWIGCVDGQQVAYPEVFGTSDWNLVPYGSRIVNEDFACLGGVTINEDIEPPRILPGTTHFAVTAPSDISRSVYQISIDHQKGGPAEVLSVSGTTLVYKTAPADSVSIRVRQSVNGVWKPWSDPVDYRPGEANSDLPTCGGLYATTTSMTGTPDADVIVGTDANDVINARGGDDIICARGGDDSVIAGIGKDRVFGGTGNDSITAGRGADLVRGEAGNDDVRGGDGKDTIFGGPGNDVLLGNAGRDVVDGGNGDDKITGGIGHDLLRGGANNDTLEGRNGRDVLLGGNGNDRLAGDNGNDRLVGGAGSDQLVGGPGSDRCAFDDTDEVDGCER